MSGASSLQRLIRRCRGGGLRWLVGALADRAFPARPAMRAAVLAAVQGRVGLEVGGPSRIFGRGGILPVYDAAERIDNVNYAAETAWENQLQDNGEFHFNPVRSPGRQWLREAVAFTGVADGSYDFVLSSHCLEHVANPLRALREWRRIAKPRAPLVLVLPDPAKTFDHRRPVSTIVHLREDFARDIGEHDLTHADEAIALHDVARDAGVGSAAEFAARVRENACNRCLHHHVFDLALMRAVLAETGWQTRATETVRPMHLVAFAENSRP